jgi:hypothetical protein
MENQDDQLLLKHWAMLAKKAKDYFYTAECQLIH